jgi:hypothetical protein
MLRCSTAVRKVSESSQSLEEAAQNIVQFIYQSFTDRRGPQCALVRFYRTQAYGELPHDLKHFAKARLNGVEPDAYMRSLVLLATAGEVAEWNDRRLSVGHRAIPLPSVEIVEQAPMVAQLIREVGFELSDVVKPPIGLIQDNEGKTYNVFHVEQAVGSPFIPAQNEFVIPFGIKSVVGFGGLMTSGEFFAVIVFAKTHIPRDSAIRFRNVALEVKAALFGLAGIPVFPGES